MSGYFVLCMKWEPRPNYRQHRLYLPPCLSIATHRSHDHRLSNPSYFRSDPVSPSLCVNVHCTSMSEPMVYWCACRRYCKGVRKALNTLKTWRRHLREVSSEDEKEAIHLAGRSEQFCAFVQGASTTWRGQNQSEEQENSSPGIGSRCPAANDVNESHRRTSRRLSPLSDFAGVFSCVDVCGFPF